MITSLIFYLLGYCLFIVRLPLTLLTLIIPTALLAPFQTLFGTMRAADGIFPITDILTCIGLVAAVYLYLYIVKFVLFIFSLIPFLGKTIALPDGTGEHMSHTRSSTASSDGRGGVRKTVHEKYTRSR